MWLFYLGPMEGFEITSTLSYKYAAITFNSAIENRLPYEKSSGVRMVDLAYYAPPEQNFSAGNLMTFSLIPVPTVCA